jgi:hypothetical protein
VTTLTRLTMASGAADAEVRRGMLLVRLIEYTFHLHLVSAVEKCSPHVTFPEDGVDPSPCVPDTGRSSAQQIALGQRPRGPQYR